MDRRSWPWKKKSYDGNSSSRAADAPLDLPPALALGGGTQNSEQEASFQEDRSRHLLAKLSAAFAEITSKEDLVKQHAKVAEEAVTGWEKAEKEAVVLKEQLDAALVHKSGLQDRVAHLDAALKECMRELRHFREEHESLGTKAKEWEKAHLELEAKLADANGKVAESEAQKSALSKLLQERARTVCELTDAKARAEADASVLQVHKEEVEKRSLALKYELQVASKEVELRNEEKEDNKKMADALSKQQLESTKKIARMEAECQRLRGLVKKKLPGPAALAQMKLEAEDGKRPKASLDDAESKEADKVLLLQEETKVLKEALAKRNNELQAAKLMCARTASKLSLVEDQLHRSRARPAFSSDGGGEEHASADSWASALVAELEQFRKGKDDSSTKPFDSSSSFDLMDDFIEMERLTTTSAEQSSSAASECGVPIHDESTRLDEVLVRKEHECLEAKKTCEELRKKLVSSEEKIKELEQRKHISQPALEMKAKITDMDKILAEARDRFGLRKTREQDMTGSLDKLVRLVQELAQEVGSIDLDKLVLAKQHLLQEQGGAVQEVLSELSAALERLLCSWRHGEHAEFNTRAILEEDIANLKNEKSNMELQLGAASERVERFKVQLSDSEQLVSNLRVQLSSTEESKRLAENDLTAMAIVKAELESKVRAAGVEIGQLQEDAEACRSELEQERARYQELLRGREKQQSHGSEEGADKEQEIAAAAERLAECQRTIMVLGKQLQSLSRPSKSSRDFTEASATLHSESEEEEQWQQMYRSASDISRIRNAREAIRKQEVYWSSATSTESYAGSGGSSPMDTKSSKGLTRFFLRGK